MVNSMTEIILKKISARKQSAVRYLSEMMYHHLITRNLELIDEIFEDDGDVVNFK